MNNTPENLTSEEILKHWPTHRALWLDPQLLEKHALKFSWAARISTDEHIDFLMDMSRTSVSVILQSVARNKYTPTEILPSFLHDDLAVEQLIFNPNSSSTLIEQALYRLRKQYIYAFRINIKGIEDIYNAVAHHPNSGARVLDAVARYSNDAFILRNITNHPNISKETLEWVLTNKSHQHHLAREVARVKLQSINAKEHT